MLVKGDPGHYLDQRWTVVNGIKSNAYQYIFVAMILVSVYNNILKHISII